jgi:hypothetical protein
MAAISFVTAQVLNRLVILLKRKPLFIDLVCNKRPLSMLLEPVSRRQGNDSMAHSRFLRASLEDQCLPKVRGK